MTRDLDLIRKLLLSFEKEGKNLCEGIFSIELNYNDYDNAIVSEHISLLYERWLIDVVYIQIDGVPFNYFRSISLTNDGHDFLEKIRDKSVWSKIKKKLSETKGDINININLIKLL